MNVPARLPATAQNSITVAMSERFGMLPEAFEATVRATCGMANATREEFAALILVAKEYGLNPILKEIYAYPKKGGGIVPVVSIDGWVNLINSQPQLDGIEFDIEHDDAKELVAITCRIYRKDRRVPVSVTEYLAECKRPTDPWKMEHRMLRHKALIQCARYAFGFSNIHDEDEAQRIVEAVEKENAPPPAPPIDLPDMRRATDAVIEHKPAAPVAPAPEQPGAPVPRAQAQAVVADPAAAASNSEEGEPRPGAEILAEAKTHLDNARSIGDVADIRALYADDEEHLTRSERETFQHLCEEAEARLQNPATAPFGKPVEPVEAPKASKEPAAAEAPQAGDAEDWAAYESRITRLANATHDEAGAAGLRKVWKAGKDYRALMEQREACTRQQRVALTALVQDAIKRAEAPKADPELARLSAAPDITNTGSEAVRACGEELFTALYEATTREGAFKIWSRSASKRDACGASAEVLDAWAKEYREIRQRLPDAG